jgi:hypothetical protein
MARMMLGASDVLHDSVALAQQLKADAEALALDAVAIAALGPPKHGPVRMDRRRAQRDALLTAQDETKGSARLTSHKGSYANPNNFPTD